MEAVKELLEDDLKNKIHFQPCTTTLIRKLYHVQPKKNSRLVAVSIALDREEQRFGEQQKEILKQVANAIKKIYDKGYQIAFVVHVEADIGFLPYLDELEIKYERKNFALSLPNEIINFYKKCNVVIGMRGHAQMIPFGIDVKIVTLGTHAKMRWFLEDVNMGIVTLI